MEVENSGAIIEKGPQDWQIFQQNDEGEADIAAGGRWFADEPAEVEVRIVSEETGGPAGRKLDWQPAETRSDGTWNVILYGVPAGGLYRLETRCRSGTEAAGEWSLRGDMRHFLGVGDIWIIAGQSNSVGYGREPVHDPPEPGIHTFRNSGRWTLAAHPLDDSTDSRFPECREKANPGHSPYLNFARLLKVLLNFPIGLVPTALGGSQLAYWDPTREGPATLFHNMLELVEKAGGRIKGMVWHQGESDGSPERASDYEARFARALDAWREALKNPSLPVITAQINRHRGPGGKFTDKGWSILREAQRQSAGKLRGVFVVPTLDLPLNDIGHNSSAGNMVLGCRMASCALGAVYGRSVDWRAPDLERAVRSDDGGSVVLGFSGVTSRMGCVDPSSQPFLLEDEQGEVAVVSVDYPGGDTVRLQLGRRMTGKARVHGCFGINPPIGPMDMERAMPMLAFHGVPVT